MIEFEDDIFGAARRAREQWDEPTRWEGWSADDLNAPVVFPGSPDVRASDPVTSHMARDRAIDSVEVARLIERALELHGRPLVADEIHRVIVQELGVRCMAQRVRTVLANGAGGAWVRSSGKFGRSHAGNPAFTWELKEAA